MEFFQGALLHGHIGFDVMMGSDRALVTEPQRDDTDVDASLQQVHRRSVADGVW